MNYVIFDLEWNGCYSKKTQSYINEIIEFGAVKLDEQLNIIDKYQMLVRPEIGKRLSSSIQTLTSLTNEQLERGAPFHYAYSKFRKFCSGCVLMTWSTSDIDALVSNVQYHLKQNRISFMTRYADLQQYCQDMLGLSHQNALGLQPAAELLNIDADEIPHHRALGDSILSAMCFRKLFHQAIYNTYIEDAVTEEFYTKLFFHPSFIKDLNSEDIDRSVLFFNCPKCGARARIKTDWELRNKGFTAEFSCPHCGNMFKGRIQFKQKYDGIVYIKKPINTNREEIKS